jgi:DNA mismatch endonuclease, patch repair protein
LSPSARNSHGCPKHATQPKTNAAFWRKKIETNRARDRRVNRAFCLGIATNGAREPGTNTWARRSGQQCRANGWTVIRIWEHELRHRVENKLLLRLRKLIPAPKPMSRNT